MHTFLMNSLLIVSFILLDTPSFGADLFVKKMMTTGISSQDQESLNHIFQTEVGRLREHAIVNRMEKSEFVLEPKVIRLGSAYIASVEKLDAKGRKLYSSQLKGLSLEELDKIFARLITSVMEENPVQTQESVENITMSETQEGLGRRESNRHWIIGFGPSRFFNLGDNTINYGFNLGYNWDIESHVAVRVLWQGVVSSSQSFHNFGLGGSYLFSEKKTSFLVFGDFGYGEAEHKDRNSANGFALGFGPGVRFFRTSKVNAELQARFGLLLKKIPYHGNDLPSTFGVSASILF